MTPKVGISRVCVKASRAFGPRRFHTNTDYIVFCSVVVVVVGGERTRAPPLDVGPSDPGTVVGGRGEHLMGQASPGVEWGQLITLNPNLKNP